MIATPETFWTLLRDRAHWEFELFLMVLFDGLIVGLLWPFARLHWRHHIDRDKREGGIVPDRGQFIQHVPIKYRWTMHAIGRDGQPLGPSIPMDPPKPKVTGPGYATRDDFTNFLPDQE